MVSVQIINVFCSLVAGISLFFGSLAKNYISERFALHIAFALLFFIGISKLMDSITKSVIRKHAKLDKSFKFSLFNLKFILSMYADPETADIDTNGILSAKESVALAFTLSLDGMAVDFGASMASINPWAVILASLVINFAALISGRLLGNKMADKLPFEVSWVSGLILIGLAVWKLL